MWNSKKRMTKREYLKYNNPEAFDIQGKYVKPGDTVVVNNNYYSTPLIGVVDHYTETGNLAVCYNWISYRGNVVKCWLYRPANKVVKIKNGHRSKNKNKS